MSLRNVDILLQFHGHYYQEYEHSPHVFSYLLFDLMTLIGAQLCVVTYVSLRCVCNKCLQNQLPVSASFVTMRLFHTGCFNRPSVETFASLQNLNLKQVGSVRTCYVHHIMTYTWLGTSVHRLESLNRTENTCKRVGSLCWCFFYIEPACSALSNGTLGQY
jgi:hypothetical protein